MAINIIKHGKATFKAVCPICGCEFTYQSEDLKEDIFHNHYVECPDCKNSVSHEYEDKKKGITWRKNLTTVDDEDTAYPKYPNTIYTTTTPYSWPDCATCPNRPDPNKPAQAGDTPCTWCRKNQPYCNTQTFNGYTIPKEYYTATGSAQDVYINSYVSDSCYYTDNEGNKHLLR